MKKIEKSLLFALALGDGYVRLHKGSYQLQITHSVKQLSLLNFKISLLEDILQKNIYFREINQQGYKSYRLEVYHPYFKIIRRLLYPDGKKLISAKILDKINTPQCIAIWYMDDGSLYSKRRNGKIHAFELVISTYCSEEEAKLIVDFFYRFYNLNFTLKRNKGKFSIRCGTKEAKKFIELVRPYIIKEFSYKITM